LATATQQDVRDNLFIGGEWVDPQGSYRIEVINPTTEEAIGSIPEASPQDVDRAVGAARDAFERWSQTDQQQRADFLRAIAAGLDERADEVAATISAELGMPLKLSRRIQAGLPIASFASMPEMMEEVAWEEEVGNTRIVREPIGVL
jgi:aldehyde dehydrogenase (NAD+)